ncbi:hypothetical protein DKT77_04485 [Meridianimarinicoccus roseus]|uniref:ABC transporter domain-containing protein n=1 Tax=Meridianimarinicoccus roseus TaxID=2072018 RepID=A0A2V2LFJ2_9RHOB|nr:hypothetical protein DKT77_04485 [Meridianimarinicoccus roseus]
MVHGLPGEGRVRFGELKPVTERTRQDTASAAAALQLRGITKTFGAVRVLDRVDFDARAGEIHALLGENGAGKSTLMNVLNGIYAADAGVVVLAGAPAAIRSPAQATRAGIGMVHQSFRLVGPFTGRENLRLAASHLAWSEVDRRATDLMARIGLEAPLDVPVARLSMAEQQRIEILKALVLGARMLVLDEPTAVLTDAEADRLLALMRDLAGAGLAIVLITHKLREVMAAGDRVSVLRRGRMVMGGVAVSETSAADLSLAMIGDHVPEPERPERMRRAQLMEARGLSVHRHGVPALRGVDLTVHAGEILGLVGIGGNGQRELAEAILGLCPAEGQIWLDGRQVSEEGVAARRALGLRYVPADRRQDALAPNMPVADNLVAAAVQRGEFGRWALHPSAVRARADRLIGAFAIAGAPRGGRRPVRLLSGGNAQKVVLARELDPAARLIVAHSPTQGLDVSAQAFVHSELLRAVGGGAGVLLISEDLEEIMRLADRIAVISRGRISTGAQPRPSREDLGELMLGHA